MLAKNFRERSKYGKLKLNCLHRDNSPAWAISNNDANVGVEFFQNKNFQGLYFRRHALQKSSLPVQFDPLETLLKVSRHGVLI